MTKTTAQKNPLVDTFMGNAKMWRQEFAMLRQLLLQCELTEELKWGSPCYVVHGKNVVMIGGFRDFCCLSFFKGSLMADPHGLLCKPGENTRTARIVKFTGPQAITDLEGILLKYVQEAIDLEKEGRKADVSEEPEMRIPDELLLKFEAMPALKEAFEKLTPGRRRAYLMFFSGAKQTASRTSRIEKMTPRILSGKGLHDCHCGLSKKMPYCDGSHRFSDPD